MPILERETSLFPETLFNQTFEEHQNKSDLELNWYAFYTTSRQEKAFMRKLLDRQVSFYCPIVANKNRSPKGRVRTSHLPLFSNYVFVFGDFESRIQAFETNCISRCLEVEDSAALHEQLKAIETLIQCGEPVTIESRLMPGVPVRIKSGSLKGLTGTVFQRRGTNRLLVGVQLLQQGASVELNDWEVEPC
ncbi:transcription termination/antitermination protein NusG [Rubinisphaera sp. JC750]|uniref:transcription termination/antitermination protein NusG n=1 Tax=Rubinisphaera sp. JC750 TaxID=2898658 RepID=UPI001F2DD67B|nr:UpxY family transcription antiterminator [Rubinisphaera sp. JC750]